MSARPAGDSAGMAAASGGAASEVEAMHPFAAKSNAFFHARWKSPE